jgi:hypothetical protein
MTDAAIASLASSVQILAEGLAAATTTDVEPSTIITAATTTSSNKRRGITASSGIVEGEYIDIDILIPYSVPEFLDLIHPTLRQRRAMRRKEKALIWGFGRFQWDWGHDLALYKLGRELTKFSRGDPLIAVVFWRGQIAKTFGPISTGL